MTFMDNLNETLDEDFNVSITENGAVGYRTTGKALLDLNFAVSSLRNKTDEEVITAFKKAYAEDKLLAIKWLFFAGDVRGGLGERRLFRLCLKYLARVAPKGTRRLLPLVAEYTRFDHLLALLDTSLKGDVCALLKAQIEEDLQKMEKGESISLCAKWLPSVNASSKTAKENAKILIKAFGYTEKQYRKTLAKLRAYSNVLEVKMSGNRWDEISYEGVPSRANLIYKDAFLRHDNERREAYLQKLEKGETTINAGVLFPHDIVHKYFNDTSGFCRDYYYGELKEDVDPTLEELWKALPDYVQGADTTLCVADGSGSMQSKVGGTSVCCLDVANALAIYFSERCKGEFKDKYITFSEHPQFVDLSKRKTLRDKIETALAHDEVADTNIQAVFMLILKTAIKHKMKQEDLPKNILILSDMEFNSCACSDNFGTTFDDNFNKLFKVIGDKYEENGYCLPRLIFWNICSRTQTIPLKENEYGVALVSGFSPIVTEMVLSGKLDPFECLLEQLNKERYAPVEAAVTAITK